jgi:glycosyltransferase involved in cell wall biosynthesis
MYKRNESIDITHIITTIDNGGAEKQLLLLVKEQITAGLNVGIVYLKGNSELKKDFRIIGGKFVLEIENKNIFSQLFYLWIYFKKYSGLVHAHLPQSELMVRFTIRNQKFIISRHYGDRFWPKSNKWFSAILSRYILTKVDKVIAISEAVKKYLYESKEVPLNTDINVVLYGFNNDFYHKSAFEDGFHETLSLVKNKFVIGSISRLAPEKDLYTFLDAIKSVSERDKNIVALIVGDGELRSKLMFYCEKLELQDFVKFLGRKNNVIHYFELFDVFVLTSKFEGFGLVLLEAMATKLPIIATDTSAIPEVIGNGGPGILVNIGDYNEIANNIIRLKNNNSEKERIASASLRWLQNFNSAQMAKKIKEVYDLK